MKQKGFINIFVIVGIIVVAGAAGYLALNQRPSPVPTSPESTSTIPIQTPIEPNSNEKLVSLGEEFTLKKGETARVRGLNVFLKVKDFIYSPCPTGAKCIWSGLAVDVELTVDGKVYKSSWSNLPPEAPYDILVKKTDYKTYATLVINKPEVKCAELSGVSQDDCWQGLALRFNDQSYCSKIDNTLIKDRCFEYLAE